jgi:hypothetical protein
MRAKELELKSWGAGELERYKSWGTRELESYRAGELD